MKPYLALLLCYLCSFSLNAQKICFEDFQAKITTPIQASLEKAKTDKESDSLYNVLNLALKNLEGCLMPDFNAKTLKGEVINKDILRGKIVIMNFWFIGCEPCLAEIPALNKLVEKYKNEEVVFLAFGSDSRKSIVNKFLPKHKFKYQIITDSEKYAEIFHCSSWPTNLVFDQNGILKDLSHGGFLDERAKTAIYNRLSPIINKLLDR